MERWYRDSLPYIERLQRDTIYIEVYYIER